MVDGLWYKILIDILCHNAINNCIIVTIFVIMSSALSDEIFDCIKITVG